jgi:hypothetical protein
MPTKQDCLNSFLETYPEADAAASRLFNEAYRSLIRRLNMRRTSGTVAAVADQALYDLPFPNAVEVESVYWEASADSSFPLAYQSSPERDIKDPGWRHPASSASAPEAYSIESVYEAAGTTGTGKLQIRVEPAPDANASGSPAYPRIAVYGRREVEISNNTHSIGSDFIDIRPIVSLMKALHAEEQNDPALAGLQQVHDQHVQRQQDFLSAFSEEAADSFSFLTIARRRVRV